MTSVRWEGDLTGRNSLAFVNRAIVNGLLRSGIRVELGTQQPGPYKVPAKAKVKTVSGDVDVTVRHAWPPRLIGDHAGKLVFWQPWEYGAVPRDWAQFASSVADEVWCYTNYVKRCYSESGVAESKTHLVPLGVDLGLFHYAGKKFAVPDAACTFLFVGGTIARKGIDVLLQAFVEAFPNRDDVQLIIKGFGSNSFYKGSGISDLIGALERARPVAPRVLYMNSDMSDTDLASLYRAADVLVHPYRGEGYGLPVAEALACGKPVIVTSGGSTDDFVPPQAAWLIPAQRTVLNPAVLGIPTPNGQAHWLEPDMASLVEALRDAANNTSKREAASKAARTHRSTLAWQAGLDAAVRRVRCLAAQDSCSSVNASKVHSLL